MRLLKLIFVISTAFAAAAPYGAKAQNAAEVIVSPVRTAPFIDKTEALGTLRANETVDVTATVSDTITAIYFEDSARIEEGDTLVAMASQEERALLEEARAAAKEARQQLQRAEPLVEQGTVSRSILDQRRREYETAIARRSAIQSRLEDRVITAPFGGVVGLRTVSVGALVSPGDIITTLHDDSIMKLDFAVPATFLGSLRPGIEITATSAAFPDSLFTGRVSGVNNQVDPVTRAITVRAVLENEQRLLVPGLLMTVTLYKNQRQATVIDEAALIPIGRQNYVYVVDVSAENPTAERRQVEVGARRPGYAEILNGLDAGEHVVTRGMERLRPGAAVSIRAIDTDKAPLGSLLNGDPARG
ncbi:MAG: efflux RND transporter periplasmic adaptor subunit [Pseudomonadota bacterium]